MEWEIFNKRRMELVKKIIKMFVLKTTSLFGVKSEIEKEVLNRLNPFLSYSQEGEDKILARFLEGQKSGFYIDIGAFHPTELSNTYMFYKMGWRGINIDAMPGSMEPFNKIRPGDINLEIPISSKRELLTYYIFNRKTLNTFSKEEAERKNGWNNFKLIKEIELETYPLSDILNKYLPQGQNIDFMSIDVEGFDYEVLQSNDWANYKPKFILVESLRSSLEEIQKDPIYIFLKMHGYEFSAKTYNTLFFKSRT